MDRRLVLMLVRLTFAPPCRPLAATPPRRDIFKILCHPRHFRKAHSARPGGSKSRPSRERRTYRGRAAGRQGFGGLGQFPARPENALNLSFCAYSDRKTGAHFFGIRAGKTGFMGVRRPSAIIKTAHSPTTSFLAAVSARR